MRFNIPVDQVLTSKTKLKALKHLFAAEAPMSESEMASLIRVSHMSINRIMRELKAWNLVFSERAGNVNIWKVNKKSYAYQVLFPLLIEIAKIPLPFDHLRKTILKILPQRLLKKIVLYGSVARGQEKINSDIDLFVLVKDERDKNRLQPFINDLIDACSDYYGNNLSPYILSEKELKKKRKPLLLEIEKGKQIYP